eukprot:CAMPEP_0182559472 /NCGR_PEP_ID=MMETSP1324-20130603/2583_1 /TAXON_ID=236786 /ORGANISM="Florenciella sp., Strain RCC1587" /LENGTH=535 /DNA_ID=CAMNT_0024771737 /DNA_START=59 /DNA_END=1666 /DNA_ORIENTATION=+
MSPAEERERRNMEGEEGVQMETPEMLAHRPLPPVEGSSPGETGRPVPHRRTAEGIRYAPSDRGAVMDQPRSPLSEQEILKMQVAELTAKLSATRGERDALAGDLDMLHNRYRSVKDELSKVLFEELVEPTDMRFSSIPSMLSKSNAAVKQAQYGMNSHRGRVIWKSALSVVRSEIRVRDNMPCVVKMIRKANCRKVNSVRNLNREISILKLLDHPTIVPMIDHWHEQDHVCMVFKLHKQDLFGLSNDYGNGMPEVYVIQILRSIADAVHYMHGQQVYHRDLKPENILITGDGTEMNPYQAVIIDFGISIMANELDAQGHATGIVGSPAFYAPDMLNRRPYAPDKADLWSFGCVLLELVVGHIIFKNEWMPCYDRAMTSSLTSFLDSIRRALAVMLPEQGANTELLRAITSLLQIDPELRIKPGTLSMRFAKDLPVDTFGDNLVHRRTRESSTSGDNADEERRRLVWGSSSAAAEAESPVGVMDSTGGDSELGTWLPSLTSPSDRELELLTRDTDESLYEDQRRIQYSQTARDCDV